MVVASGFVTAGKLLLRNREAFDARLLRFPDGEVLARIEVAKAARSRQQNRWYWGQIVQLISNHTGFTPDEMHEVLKAKFLPKTLAIANGNGEVIGEYVIGGTTVSLGKNEFGEYCEGIRGWAAECLGVVIPDPDPEI